MSSFLFNVILVLLATQAAIQFCAQAFELYADNSAIQKIWGGQVTGCLPFAFLSQLLPQIMCQSGVLSADSLHHGVEVPVQIACILLLAVCFCWPHSSLLAHQRA